MKVSPEEMRRLLGLPSSGESQPEREAVALPPTDAKGAADSRRSSFTPAHFLLGRALPNLWRFAQAQPEAADARLLHRKLRELMNWVLTKEGFVVRTNVATPYQRAGALIEGRLELLIERPAGTPMLAVETDWFGDESSLLKLKAWHDKGVPALWVLGRACSSEALAKFRTQANRTLRDGTGRWLAIYHLDHGWLRAARST